MYRLIVNEKNVGELCNLNHAIAQGCYFYAQGYSVDVICLLTGEILFSADPGVVPEISTAVVYAV